MPIHEECLDAIFRALRGAGLTVLSGPQRLEMLDDLAKAEWPVAAPPLCGDLLQDPCSAALAFSLALLTPSRGWDAQVALTKFLDLAAGFQEIWKHVPHSNAQKLRKIVDHMVVVYIREAIREKQNRAPAMEVFYTLLSGNIGSYQGPIGGCARFLRGNPIGPPGEDGVQAMTGLIPDLDRCWQEDFRMDASNWHVGYIRNRLLQPFIPWPAFAPGDFVTFDWDDERETVVVEANWRVEHEVHRDRIPAGSRRTYQIESGSAILHKGDVEWGEVPEGQRMILRVMDRSKAQIQLAEAVGENMGGPTLNFGPDDEVWLENRASHSVIEAWSCTCGTLHCGSRHRLDGWDPRTMPAEMTLRSFLGNAIKGRSPQLHINSFIQGMYYALLCSGD